MNINQKKFSSKSAAKPTTAPSQGRNGAKKEKRSSPDETADSLAPSAHAASPAPRATPPTPSSSSTVANGTPRASIIERVRLEALHLRTHEVVKALSLVAQNAQICRSDIPTLQDSIMDNNISLLHFRNPPAWSKKVVWLNQLTACDLIHIALTDTADDSKKLQSAIHDFAAKMASGPQLGQREDLSTELRAAQTRIMDKQMLLKKWLQEMECGPVLPLFEQYIRISTAALNSIDDALDFVREMRVLHLTAAKYT